MTRKDVIKEIDNVCGKGCFLQRGWYMMEYQGLQLVYIPERKGCGLLRFSVPHLFSSEEYGLEKVGAVINQTNCCVKYVKAVLLKNGIVSLNYDHKITEDENIGEIVRHIITTLYMTSRYVREELLRNK